MFWICVGTIFPPFLPLYRSCIQETLVSYTAITVCSHTLKSSVKQIFTSQLELVITSRVKRYLRGFFPPATQKQKHALCAYPQKSLYRPFILCIRMNAKMNETNREIGKMILPAALTDSLFYAGSTVAGANRPAGNGGSVWWKLAEYSGRNGAA